MTEAQQRAAVVNESLTWLRTKFHHEANVKGAGVDCLHFIVEVYVACGLMVRPVIPHYPQDIMLHRNEETYLEGLLLYTKEVAAPQPAMHRQTESRFRLT